MTKQLLLVAVLSLSGGGCQEEPPADPTYYVLLSVTATGDVRLATANFKADVTSVEGHQSGTSVVLGGAGAELLRVEADLQQIGERVRIDVRIKCTVPIVLGADDFEDLIMSSAGAQHPGMLRLQPGEHQVVIEGRPVPRDMKGRLTTRPS